MKFCSKCGHEMVDEAVICTNCGCAVENFTTPERKKQKVVDPNKGAKMAEIFTFIFSLVIVVCLFFVILSFAFSYVYVNVELGGERYGDIYFNEYSDYRIDYVAMLLAMITTCVSLAVAVTGFFVTLISKLNRKYIFSSVTQMWVSLVLFVATLIAFIS